MPIHRKPQALYWGMMPREIEVNGEKAIYFTDGNNNIMSKEDFHDMVRLAEKFYNADGAKSWMDKRSRMQDFLSHLQYISVQTIDDKYPMPEPEYSEKKYREDMKRPWIYYCDWCKRKVSSEEGGTWFDIKSIPSGNYDWHYGGKCCSKSCAENFWYERLINSIQDNGLTDVFHLDKNIK